MSDGQTSQVAQTSDVTQVPHVPEPNYTNLVQCIIAVDVSGGMGLNNRMPWKCAQELKHFKQKTLNSNIVVGRKTLMNLPCLKDRNMYCLSKTLDKTKQISVVRASSEGCKLNLLNNVNNAKIINDIDEIKNIPKPVFIVGGASVYTDAIESGIVDVVHLSIMKKTYICDAFIDMRMFSKYKTVKTESYDDFTYYVMVKRESE